MKFILNTLSGSWLSPANSVPNFTLRYVKSTIFGFGFPIDGGLLQIDSSEKVFISRLKVRSSWTFSQFSKLNYGSVILRPFFPRNYQAAYYFSLSIDWGWTKLWKNLWDLLKTFEVFVSNLEFKNFRSVTKDCSPKYQKESKLLL